MWEFANIQIIEIKLKKFFAFQIWIDLTLEFQALKVSSEINPIDVKNYEAKNLAFH